MLLLGAVLGTILGTILTGIGPIISLVIGWTGSPNLANSVAMDALSVSTILGTS